MFKNSLIGLLLLSALLFSGCIITGKVTDENGNGIEGVTVTLTGAANLTTTTGSNGGYIFGNFFDWILGANVDQLILIMPGSYTVTSTKAGRSFTPSSSDVSVTEKCYGPLAASFPWPVGGVNFEATEATCTYSISPSSGSFTPSSGTGSISVTSASGCVWTASESVSWVAITSGSSGSGNGTVTYSVSANTDSSSRSATITVAGQSHTVTQSGVSSNELIPPTMISPIPLSSFTSSTVTFIWNSGDYTTFAIYIETLYGTFSSDVMTDNSITIINLPTDGSLVAFSLYYWDGTKWNYNTYSYKAFQETSTISSYIVSDFDGLEEGKIFKLANGQYWKQTEFYFYFYFYFWPDVLIYQSGGSYLMKVEGIDKAVKVVRLTPYVESYVNGSFSGWDGDTIVELANGQIWVQTQYYYEYDYSYNADVMVYYDGGYKMWVEGIDESVGVERVQ